MTQKFQTQNKKIDKVVVPMDKLSKKLATLSPADYADSIGDAEPNTVDELPNSGKKVTTKYWLKHDGDFNDMTPLSWFDLSVMAVCYAYYKRGEVTTFNTIHRILTGSTRPPTEEQKKEIENSAVRLMKTVITLDLTELYEVNAKSKRPRWKLPWDTKTAPLLPCTITRGALLNGKKTDIIEVYADSPLFAIAEAKRQLTTVDTKLLAAPGMKNNRRALLVKVFVLVFIIRMVEGLKAGRKNTPSSLTFEAVYEAAGVADETDSIKQNVREEAVKTAEWLKTQGVIRDFKLERDGNRYHSITFSIDNPAN